MCCLPHTKKLTLTPEEAVLVSISCTGTSTSRRPYGELGSVDVAKQCGCCWAVSSQLGPISPGCGCDEALVNDIHKELKRRMQTRGDQGQIQRAEEVKALLNEVRFDNLHLHAKMDALLSKMGVAIPPKPQTMGGS